MGSVDLVGYLASALVLVTFYMRDMVPLRIAALCSNAAFLSYGVALHLTPVVVLHGALIPMNLWRLASALREKRKQQIEIRAGCDFGSETSS